MREQHKNILVVVFPAILMFLTLCSVVLKNSHFPFLGNMIIKAEKDQLKLQNQIAALKQAITEKHPQLERLKQLKALSLPNGEDINGQFRTRVEQAFYTSGANIRTVGNPRKVTETEDIELYEINITATVKVNELLRVIEELSKPPALLWRIATFRPNNMLDPDFVNVNFTIGGIVFTGEQNSEN